jgi:hypothetical protein
MQNGSKIFLVFVFLVMLSAFNSCGGSGGGGGGGSTSVPQQGEEDSNGSTSSSSSSSSGSTGGTTTASRIKCYYQGSGPDDYVLSHEMTTSMAYYKCHYTDTAPCVHEGSVKNVKNPDMTMSCLEKVDAPEDFTTCRSKDVVTRDTTKGKLVELATTEFGLSYNIYCTERILRILPAP